MNDLWLIKVGEITLKKGNRAFFERLLKENVRNKLKLYKDLPKVGNTLSSQDGRYFLTTDCAEEDVVRLLETTPGIVGFSKAFRVAKTLEALSEMSIAVARECLAEGLGKTFKFEIRRTDKSLPLDSYGYARQLGNLLLKAIPELIVDVHRPDFVIRIELREWGYIYQKQRPGAGGLPVGTAGRGMLLLSGGIDSPVAGQMMAKRGLKLTAIHFHTPPYTSPEALDKVLRLAGLIAPWCEGLVLYSVPFTECQVHINRSVDPSATTLHSRACMMMIAEKLAEKKHCTVLVTGESLGQVASQTQESMSFTDSSVAMTVFRPLIGLDKEEIIIIARKIGTFETSVEPYDDCCSIFSPERPLTRPDVQAELSVFDGIEGLENLAEQAVNGAVECRFDARGRKTTL